MDLVETTWRSTIPPGFEVRLTTDVACPRHDPPPDNPPSREVLIWSFADDVVEIRLWG